MIRCEQGSQACRCVYDEKKKVIVGQNHTFFRGLTQVLKKWAKLSITRILRQCPYRPRNQGKKKGTALDREVTRYLQNPFPPSPGLQALLDAIVQKGWTLEDSQVTVGCLKRKLGTRLDLICRNQKQELIVLELKYGFENYHRVSLKNLKWPCTDLPASFETVHFLQLWLSCWLWSHNFPDQPIKAAYLVRVHQEDDSLANSEFQVAFDRLPIWLQVDRQRLQQMLSL